MKLMVFFISLLTAQGFTSEKKSNEICLNKEEKELYHLIMRYRKEKGLSSIPLSAKLTLVAQTHTRDLTDNYAVNYSDICNPHSWSSKGKWSYCCYTHDHRHAKCMWGKPKEISGYEDNGYEIVYYRSGGVTAAQSLMSWKESAGHNPLIVNEGPWAKIKWNAIGIGVHKSFSAVWFGGIKDPDDVILCP